MLSMCVDSLSRTATDYSTLQHTAAHLNTQPHDVSYLHVVETYHLVTMHQHAATHCNTLQHTAAHCSILQRNVSHQPAYSWVAPPCPYTRALARLSKIQQISHERDTRASNRMNACTCAVVTHATIQSHTGWTSHKWYERVHLRGCHKCNTSVTNRINESQMGWTGHGCKKSIFIWKKPIHETHSASHLSTAVKNKSFPYIFFMSLSYKYEIYIWKRPLQETHTASHLQTAVSNRSFPYTYSLCLFHISMKSVHERGLYKRHTLPLICIRLSAIDLFHTYSLSPAYTYEIYI